MVNCTCCGKDNEPHRIICCSICGKNYDIDCVSVSAALARHIRQDSRVAWTCEGCEGLGGDLNSLKSLIINLQHEVTALKESIRTSSPATTSSIDMETVVLEVAEREKRKCNIIFFNAPELAASKNEQLALDTAMVGDVLSLLSVSPGDISRPVRLGKFDPTHKARKRPIKIKLSSEDLVLAVLRNSSKLKSSEWSYISLSRDRTRMQIDLYRRVKSEMQSRIANGEQDLSIRYKMGVPTIVKSNRKN